MNAIPRRRDACPGLFDPMLSGDGWLARISPPRSRLDARQARALDRAAATLGNGTIEITSRGNLQCRGLRTDTILPFAEAAIVHGLALPDPLAEHRRRRLHHAPLPTDDAFAAALETALVATPSLDALAPKFAVAVDDGPVPIAAAGVDILVAPQYRRVVLHDIACELPATTLVHETIGIATDFAATGARRMRDLDPDARHALLAARGHTPFAHTTPPPSPLVGTPAPSCLGVAAAYGALQPGALSALADHADRHGDGLLRFAPHAILIAGCTDPDREALARVGLVTDSADPRLRVRACAGAPSCVGGEAPARTVADRFLPLIPERGILHISGCPKGCAHPRPAALTLTGAAGGYVHHRDARADGSSE